MFRFAMEYEIPLQYTFECSVTTCIARIYAALTLCKGGHACVSCLLFQMIYIVLPFILVQRRIKCKNVNFFLFAAPERKVYKQNNLERSFFFFLCKTKKCLTDISNVTKYFNTAETIKSAAYLHFHFSTPTTIKYSQQQHQQPATTKGKKTIQNDVK